MTKLFLPLCLAVFASPSFAGTTYECESQADEKVLIEYHGEGYLTMTVRGTGHVIPREADRHYFPSLSPFVEKTPGKLSSLTHVAEMISHFPAPDDLQPAESKTSYFAYAKLVIDQSDESAPKVQWDLLGFGNSNRFEVVCDNKSLWTTDEEKVSL